MWKTSLSTLSLALTLGVNAATLNVSVTPLNDKSLPEAAIYLTPEQPVPAAEAKLADMDQVKKQFLPHILVVQKGTDVRFPNSDSIQHHVYSFSPAKVFELQLYKDRQPEPLRFDKTGLIEMGCNVHDWMLGYIYVVDTPYFTQTNKSNLASIEVPDGNYTLSLRHPRIQDPENSLDRKITASGEMTINFSLAQPLLPGLNDFDDEEDEFSAYE